jgi:hypothetical protein
MVMAKKYNSVQGKLRKGGGKGLSGDALVGKVSQSTIDSIKKMGMTEALKLAGKNGATAGGMAREFQEGVRRMYGAKRLATAKATYAPKPKMGTKTVMAPKGGVKPAAKPAAKGSSAATKAKVIGGTVAAIALAAKGGPAGRKVASKLAPGLAKSAVGRAVFGTAPKMSPSSLAKFKASMGPKAAPAKVTVGPKGSFGPTTKTMAKSKLGTASEYASKAGQASARAGIKTPTADAARAAASKVTKKKAAGASMASNKRK